ncbi:DUF5689 domain-containing protein [Aestuariivivens sp. NBU2969]|uniref:DUF5689 domain-containing protein n=1 Tax=Aestuariivivens sp. NBU2969 TaxID=2873267 RepID=UPI001CBBF9E2|nr:DUF5689 domain-containing protein [Aestuariivivens sp. NBU2969]
MKKLYFLFFAFLTYIISFGQDMIITGVFDGPLTGGVPKFVELYVVNDIADLSTFGIGSANNGGGTDGEEFSFSGSATAGDFIYVASEDVGFNDYFGFLPDFTTSAMGINGDDAIELFFNGSVIDTFGDINVDGTGTGWDYLDGWTYRNNDTGPDGSTFILSNWSFSGPDATDGCTTNGTCGSIFPIGTFTYTPSTDPTIALINGPASGSTVDLGPEDLSGELEFVVTNFNVDTEGNGGDGYIVWTVLNTTSVTTHDSGGPLYDLTPDPFIPLEPNNSYYFVAQLINYGSGSVAAEYDLNINTLGYNVVADIADLRAETEDLYYEITGEVIVSFVTGNSRNQIFIQDATGGILIDDPDGIISTLYNNNDGITGLKGMLTSFGNVSQIIPTIDPGAASSTSNTITPLSVTINDLLNNIDTYESELVQITDVTFAAGDGVTAFASSTDYDISDQSGGPLVFRTNYPNDNMAGELIPNTPTTIIVIAGQYFNTIQVYPLSPSITLSSSKYNQIEGFAMYPNPTSLGYVNIISKNQSALRVGVHDILGKQVINKTISNNRLDVSTLTTGIYIIKISQDDAITTRKLIIK